jgi:hypothetical protein
MALSLTQFLLFVVQGFAIGSASRINVDRTVLQGTVGGEAHAVCTYSAEERFFPFVLVNGRYNLVRSLASQPQYDYAFALSSDGTQIVLTLTYFNLAERDNGTTFQFEFDDNGEDRASALITLYVYPQQDNDPTDDTTTATTPPPTTGTTQQVRPKPTGTEQHVSMVYEEDHPTILTVEIIVGIAVGVVVASLVIALCIGIIVAVLVVHTRRGGKRHRGETESVECIITMDKNPAYQVVDHNAKTSVYTHSHYGNL